MYREALPYCPIREIILYGGMVSRGLCLPLHLLDVLYLSFGSTWVSEFPDMRNRRTVADGPAICFSV